MKHLNAEDIVELKRDLTKVMNRFSLEQGSDTPDFVLADYLVDCLKAWNTAVEAREKWWRPTTSIRQCPGCGLVRSPDHGHRCLP